MKKYINVGLLLVVVASLVNLVSEQVQIGAAWPDVLQVVLTTAFALIYGLFRDDDGDGVKNIHDRQPDNPTEA